MPGNILTGRRAAPGARVLHAGEAHHAPLPHGTVTSSHSTRSPCTRDCGANGAGVAPMRSRQGFMPSSSRLTPGICITPVDQSGCCGSSPQVSRSEAARISREVVLSQKESIGMDSVVFGPLRAECDRGGRWYHRGCAAPRPGAALGQQGAAASGGPDWLPFCHRQLAAADDPDPRRRIRAVIGFLVAGSFLLAE